MSHGVRVMDIAWQAYQAGTRSFISEPEVSASFKAWWALREDQNCALPACDRCGFDPSLRVTASWPFAIPIDPPSMNDRIVNVRGGGNLGGGAARRYRKVRELWGWEIRAARMNKKIPKAAARRRVTLTRVYDGRQRERDYDNLVGGMKIVLDALVLEGLLIGDDPKSVEVLYLQAHGRDRGLSVLLEDLA